MSVDIVSNLTKIREKNDEVVSIWRNWDTARCYYQRRLRRCVENWRMYVALDPELGLGQWPDEVVSYMLSQNRQLLQFNFVAPIVDMLAGALIQVQTDPEFYPVNSEINSLTKSLKKAMYSDKEQMDWAVTALEMAKDAMIFEAVIKIGVSDRFDPLGNIGFERCLPGSVSPDPFWKTWSSKDCRRCWHEQWFTAEELMEMYPEEADVLKVEAEMVARSGTEYGPFTGPTPFIQEGHRWGSAHRLIQQYDMIKENGKAEYAITGEGEIRIPDDLADEDKPAWLNEYHPTWDPMYVYSKPEKRDVCIVRAVCPDLTWKYMVAKGKPEAQIGRLPFIWYSCSRSNGEPHGIVDSIKDVQQVINYDQSFLQYQMQVQGGGGSQFVDQEGFASYAEFDRYKSSRGNPAENFEVKPGFLEAGKIPAVPTSKANFPTEFYQHLNHMIQVVLPHISRITPASRGHKESSGESGRMFQMLKQQSDQQSFIIMYGWRQVWNEIYEAYLMLATQTYSNESVPRRFSFNQGKESITLNEQIDLPDGRKGIKNDVSQLKYIRHKIVISDKQVSPTARLEELANISDLAKTAGPTKPATFQELLNHSYTLIDSIDEEELERLQELGDIELENTVAKIEAETEAAKLNKIKAQLEIRQLTQQFMAQDPGQSGVGEQGGAPSQGALQPPAGVSRPRLPAPSPGEPPDQVTTTPRPGRAVAPQAQPQQGPPIQPTTPQESQQPPAPQGPVGG